MHALVNAIVTIAAIPDTLRTARDPMQSMEGRCNVVPAYMIVSLLMYHLVANFRVHPDDVWHHLLFGLGIGGVGLHYCPGPLQNALSFFISGFPGGVDYAMLMAIKDGMMEPITEKVCVCLVCACVSGVCVCVCVVSVCV